MIGFTTDNESELRFEKSESNAQCNTHDAEKSIVTLFPEYDFLIARTYFKNRYKFWNWITVFFNLIFLYFSVGFVVTAIQGSEYGEHVVPSLLFLLTINLCIIFNRIYASYIHNKRDIIGCLYYIQNPRYGKDKTRKYSFYVDADRKWGLIKNKGLRIVIPAEYDEMTWKETDKFILASKNGKSVILDTNNQPCI